MQRVIRLAGWLFLVIVLVLVADYYHVRAKERRVSRAVSSVDGRIASIPFWPIGTEYQITFSRLLSQNELETVAELNGLRGWVGIHFRDHVLNNEYRDMISQQLADCHLVGDNSQDVGTPQIDRKDQGAANHPMQPSGEVGRIEMDDQPSPPADR
jgi:hypothetical protein